MAYLLEIDEAVKELILIVTSAHSSGDRISALAITVFLVMFSVCIPHIKRDDCS
jgi:hypothetical protein